MFKKLKEKIKLALNHSNTFAYISLSIFSGCCFLGSLFCPMNSKWFASLSAIGCSGIVSVIVAWLLERSNSRNEKKKNRNIIENLLFGYDIIVKSELERCLMRCGMNTEIKLEKDYTIQEIVEQIKLFSPDDIYFKGFRMRLEKSINKFPPITLLQIENSEETLKLYNMFDALQLYSNELNGLMDMKDVDEIQKNVIISAIEIFDKINKLRKKNVKYRLQDESIQYMQKLRNAKNCVKNDNASIKNDEDVH